MTAVPDPCAVTPTRTLTLNRARTLGYGVTRLCLVLWLVKEVPGLVGRRGCRALVAVDAVL